MSNENSFQKTFIDGLDKSAKSSVCPFCQENSWMVAEKVVTVTVSTVVDGFTKLPTAYIPAGGLVCAKCGFIRLHALHALGIDINQMGVKS